jgi:hypothetical protein
VTVFSRLALSSARPGDPQWVAPMQGAGEIEPTA